MFGRLTNFLEGYTNLHDEDLMRGERVIFESKRYMLAEGPIMLVSVFAIIGGIALFAYVALNDVKGPIGFLLNAGALILLVAGPVFFANVILSHYSIRYFLTDYRIIRKTGVFTKKVIYVPYDSIQNIRISKNLSERIMDIGDILIDTSGGDAVELVIEDIPDPEKMHRIILEKMEERTHQK
jgi:uncharacterized membrane protein YdbT with pleckstrin-like domain